MIYSWIKVQIKLQTFGWFDTTMNTFFNFETYVPLTDFETVTNIKFEDEQELSSLTKSEKP